MTGSVYAIICKRFSRYCICISVPAAHCFYISGQKLGADQVIVGLGKLFSSLNQREDSAVISYVSTYSKLYFN